MVAEGLSSATGSRRASQRLSSASSQPIPDDLPEAGPGPATAASRRARSASRRSRTRSSSQHSDAETFTSADPAGEEEDEDYENQRRLCMLENQSLLAELDLFGGASNTLGTASAQPAPTQPASHRRGRKSRNAQRLDRWGYVVSLPPPGETQVLAAIVIRTDRMTRRAIDHGEYTDCTRWAAGEERRWRFGHGDGMLQEGEAEEVGGVGPSFRWKEYGAVVDVVRAREEAAAEAMEMSVEPPTPAVPASKIPYSALPEGTCHQCRRRSDKPKMQCRNVEPQCRNLFCETCCKRYNSFEFDEECRSFICPVCMNNCNCKSCLDRHNLGHLANQVSKFGRHGLAQGQTGTDEMNEGETVQEYVERVERANRKEAPFDRVRIVNIDEDIISAPLPPEWIEHLEAQRCERLGIKRKIKPKGKGKEAKGKGKTKAAGEEGEAAEVGEGSDGQGRRKGKGKGKSAALWPLKPRGGKSAELVEQVNALAAAEPKTRGKKRPAPAELDSTAPPLKHRKGTGTATPSDKIFLRFKPPRGRAREIDSDGDSVYGYSSDETRSRSPSMREESVLPETANDFLARIASAVVPTLSTLEPEHRLWRRPLDLMDVESSDMGQGPPLAPMERGDSPAIPMSLPIDTPMGGMPISDMPLGAMPISDMGMTDLAPPTSTPSRLRLTLAPTASLDALRDLPSTSASPRTPRHRFGNNSSGSNGHCVCFGTPDVSPGQDPLPALYPSFPELERSHYQSYRSPCYPPYSPPAYSLHPDPTYMPFQMSGRAPLGGREGARYAREWDGQAPFPQSRRETHEDESQRTLLSQGRAWHTSPAHSSSLHSQSNFNAHANWHSQVNTNSHPNSHSQGSSQSQSHQPHWQTRAPQAEPHPKPTPASPQRRRKPPPTAHIVRAPKHLQDQIEHMRLHRRAV